MSCGSYIISNNIHNCKTHTHLWWDDAACALNHCFWILSWWWTYDAISKRICDIWLLFIFTSRNPKLRSLDFPTWDGFLPPPSKQQNVKNVHKKTLLTGVWKWPDPSHHGWNSQERSHPECTDTCWSTSTWDRQQTPQKNKNKPSQKPSQLRLGCFSYNFSREIKRESKESIIRFSFALRWISLLFRRNDQGRTDW